MTFPRKICLIIILKVTKKQQKAGVYPLSRKYKSNGPPAFRAKKKTCFTWVERCHSREVPKLNNKLDKIHEGVLHITYNDKCSTFLRLFEKDINNSIVISSSRQEQVCLVRLRLERDRRSISENVASLTFFKE